MSAEHFKAKCAEWERQKELIRVTQASERELRMEILKEAFGDNSIGSLKTMRGGITVKGTFGIEHKIDTKAFASALASDSIPDEAMDGIRTKYELDKKGYDNLDHDLQLILDDFITSKPTMPTLEIKYDDSDD